MFTKAEERNWMTVMGIRDDVDNKMTNVDCAFVRRHRHPRSQTWQQIITSNGHDYKAKIYNYDEQLTNI